ncbi:glycosyltransferase family 4 protein [Afifella pfennigii]|uniref:glycosyltransferase family 4 protein n=1 Tax=Afifella pfennigii TaxID=209897 RepID=UPI00146FC775|nr:glycosyltransferase family 4 protein [Afifella pfennigii]
MTDILVVGARGIPDAEGGAEKHAAMVFPRFAETGYAVTLLGVKGCLRGKSYRGVRLKALPTLNVAGTDKLIYHFLACLYAVFTRPRIVHLQGSNSALFLFLYRLAGLTTVLRYGSADGQHKKWGLVGRWAFRVCEKQMRLADHVICVSEHYRGILQQQYGLRAVDVILNGVDVPQVSEQSEAYLKRQGLAGTRYVLSVGRLTVDKDFDTLIDALERQNDKATKLVIVGGADEKGYAERLLQRASPRIRFLGRLDRSLLAALYANCALYVSTSRHEGLSNAILEAIGYGRPLLVSDIPANRQMRLSPDNYFPVGDVAALARRMAEALEAPERFRLASHSFPTWQQVFEQTEAIYRGLRPGGFRPAPAASAVDITPAE